jgi:hypothetical protein
MKKESSTAVNDRTLDTRDVAGRASDATHVDNGGKIFMALFPFFRNVVTLAMLAAGTCLAAAQGSYAPEGGEYNIIGTLLGEQMRPQVRVKTSGGYLLWQDNITDGSGVGVSARKIDGSLSGNLSPFRVNVAGADDQENPAVSLFNDGGSIFVWQGGAQGFQHIYARVLSAAGAWITGELTVNTATNFQVDPAVITLANGTAVVAWSSFNQVSAQSMRDVYFQILNSAGGKVGGETLANVTTAYNQRSAVLSPLSDGRFVMVWVSEQQRFENSVDLYGRIFSANGVGGSEFLINSGTNVCANPSVSPSADGGFLVAWMQKDVAVSTNSWDIFARPFTGTEQGGPTRRINANTYGDQLAPMVAANGNDYLVVWTSLAQDGSQEGIYGQFLAGDGSLVLGEFRVNTTTVSRQITPTITADGTGRFLAVWSSFVGGSANFDLYAQRYVNTNQPLAAPAAPMVLVLTSNTLSVTWPPVAGYDVARYEVYADGAVTATATVTNIYWNATGLAPASTHSYRMAYVLTDDRRSPLSGAATNTTYGAGATWGGIPQEWMSSYFGNDLFVWPSPYVDSDGDGASNYKEFLAGTDPANANSVLKVRLQTTSQGLFLNWNTQIGLIYQVWSASNANGPWTKVGGPRFAAETVDSMYVGGSAAAFYQIERLR